MGNRSTARRGRRGRLSLSAVAVGAVIAAFPATAWAHAEFVSNSSVPANSDQKLTLEVPEEKGPSIHNTNVVVVCHYAGLTVAHFAALLMTLAGLVLMLMTSSSPNRARPAHK